jgi:lysophospholipase L1-like esterase
MRWSWDFYEIWALNISYMKTSLGLFLIILAASLSAQVDSTYRTYFYEQRQSMFELLPDTEGEIIMLGNSITNVGAWEELFQNPRLKNRGISGDNTFGVLARMDEVLSSKPAKIFILIGINDIAINNPPEVILNNYQKIIERIIKDSPSTSIYVQSLFPTNNAFTRFGGHQNKDEQIRAVNAGIAQLAIEYGLTFIDLYPKFQDAEGKLDTLYTNDGLHLLGPGYVKWAEILRPFVEE